MIYAAVLIALALGWAAGFAASTYVHRHISLENEQLRAALRYFRGVAGQHLELKRLTRYIDNLLDDEAGA